MDLLSKYNEPKDSDISSQIAAVAVIKQPIKVEELKKFFDWDDEFFDTNEETNPTVFISYQKKNKVFFFPFFYSKKRGGMFLNPEDAEPEKEEEYDDFSCIKELDFNSIEMEISGYESDSIEVKTFKKEDYLSVFQRLSKEKYADVYFFSGKCQIETECITKQCHRCPVNKTYDFKLSEKVSI